MSLARMRARASAASGGGHLQSTHSALRPLLHPTSSEVKNDTTSNTNDKSPLTQSISVEGALLKQETKMDSLLGCIAAVDPAQFADLAPLSPTTLAEQLETVRRELLEFELWLFCPPKEASEKDIQAKLSLWDMCRQWLFAYQAELEKKQHAIAALDEELAEVRSEIRTLEDDKHRSHDEMAAADAYWDELDQRENRILRRLEDLGAPLPSEDAPAPAAAVDTRSHIQRALDQEWASANFSGQGGCPFCDSLFGGCGCWARRREAQEAEERQRVRESRAEAAARTGLCTCDAMTQNSKCPYSNLCEVCEREEALRCTGCGQIQCRPECCGDCGACSRCCGSSCKRCGDFESNCRCHEDREEDDYDPSDRYGDGAPEEHYDY